MSVCSDIGQYLVRLQREHRSRHDASLSAGRLQDLLQEQKHIFRAIFASYKRRIQEGNNVFVRPDAAHEPRLALRGIQRFAVRAHHFLERVFLVFDVDVDTGVDE